MLDDILRGVQNLWRIWNNPTGPRSFGVEQGDETFWIVLGVLVVVAFIAKCIIDDKDNKR